MIKNEQKKSLIKMIGKKIIGVENISNYKIRIAYIKWKLKGMPIPPAGMFKWKTMIKLAKLYNMKNFVETGTAGGGTTKKMSKYFDKIYTVELDPTLFNQGKAFLSNYKNINCIEGDSGIKINEILNKLDKPALFWLDAHYSGRGTAKGEIDTPIEKELESILKHKVNNHVVLIDDVREFDGKNDYPDINKIIDKINKETPWYKTSILSDFLLIEPILSTNKKENNGK